MVWGRNGNGSGLSQVFPYPDLTRGLDPARLLAGFFSRGPDLPQPGPTGPVKGLGPIRGPTKKEKKNCTYFAKKKKKPKWIVLRLYLE